MPLNPNRPSNEVSVTEMTLSIATTPVAAAAVAHCAGYVQRLLAAAAGTFTGTINVTVSINGGADIAGGNLNIPAQTGAVRGVTQELALQGAGATSGVFVNEGDIIVFTPSGGTGASIQGAFAAVIRKLA